MENRLERSAPAHAAEERYRAALARNHELKHRIEDLRLRLLAEPPLYRAFLKLLQSELNAPYN